MEMRCLSTLGFAEYILHITESAFGTPVSPYNCYRSLKKYFETMIKHGWRCTWRPGSSEFGNGLGHLETE